jgi:hypothetical protein
MSAIDDTITWKLEIIKAALKQWKDEKKLKEQQNDHGGVEYCERKIKELTGETEVLDVPPALANRKKQKEVLIANLQSFINVQESYLKGTGTDAITSFKREIEKTKSRLKAVEADN